MKTTTWFVYVERKTQPGVHQYYSESLGIGDEPEKSAQEIAVELSKRGTRCIVSPQYVVTPARLLG